MITLIDGVDEDECLGTIDLLKQDTTRLIVLDVDVERDALSRKEAFVHYTLAVFVPIAYCANKETITTFIVEQFFSWLDQHEPEGNDMWFDGFHFVEAHLPTQVPQDIVPSAYFSLESGWQEREHAAQATSVQHEQWRQRWFDHVEAGRDCGLILYFDYHR